MWRRGMACALKDVLGREGGGRSGAGYASRSGLEAEVGRLQRGWPSQRPACPTHPRHAPACPTPPLPTWDCEWYRNLAAAHADRIYMKILPGKCGGRRSGLEVPPRSSSSALVAALCACRRCAPSACPSARLLQSAVATCTLGLGFRHAARPWPLRSRSRQRTTMPSVRTEMSRVSDSHRT